MAFATGFLFNTRYIHPSSTSFLHRAIDSQAGKGIDSYRIQPLALMKSIEQDTYGQPISITTGFRTPCGITPVGGALKETRN